MPVFQGGQGTHIHGGDFHDIVGNHATYNPNSSSLVSYATTSLENDWTLNSVATSNNHVTRAQLASLSALSSMSGSQDNYQQISNKQAPDNAVKKGRLRFVRGGSPEAQRRRDPIELPSSGSWWTHDEHEDCPWHMTTLTPGFQSPLVRTQSDTPSSSSARLKSNNPFLKMIQAQEAHQLTPAPPPSAALPDEAVDQNKDLNQPVSSP